MTGPDAGDGSPVVPLRQFLLKVHSRCNLACSYCYVYEHADQSWRSRPRTMSDDTVEVVAGRIAEHARAHRLRTVRVILHGGEPLLAGADFLDRTARVLRAAIGPDTAVDLRLTTNGVLLDEEFLALFRRHRIRVAVSLDGDRAGHDRHRRFRDGRGSHHLVARGLELLAAEADPRVYAGLLCVVDLRNDPVETYRGLLGFRPPEIDFLLPHGNWTTPPPGREPGAGRTPYADWLTTVFDRWFAEAVRPTRVRLFDSVLALLLGRPGRSEAVGLAPVDLVTVETDGELEQSDALKTAGEGVAGTGLDVRRHSFDDALRHPGLRDRQRGVAALAPGCRRCPVVSTCGGGLYAHRYRAGGFDNPSVYCPDLYRLIRHVDGRLRDRLGDHADRVRTAVAGRTG